MIFQKFRLHVRIFILVLFVLAGCSPGVSSPTTLFPSVSPSPVVTILPTTTNRPAGLSDEEFATLTSLELVNDFPLYTMHYYGDYRTAVVSELARGPTLSEERIPPLPINWACSLFAALGDAQNSTYGRNFDWEFSPAMLLFTDPPDGYASISMVNLGFMRTWGEEVGQLTELPLEKRKVLLRAPFLPIDGMNEHGLVVAMAAVPRSRAAYDQNKDHIGSLGVIREMLDYATDVDEAVNILGSYNIDWSGGPPIHYLVADRTGRAILVEFYEGEMVVFPNEQPWHQATNFLLAAVGDSPEGNCWRYDKIRQHLGDTGGKLSTQGALDLLSNVAQTGTQWSVVYGIDGGDIIIVMGRDYDELNSFHQDLVGE